MTAQPARIETEAERAFREGAEALIAHAPPTEAAVRRAALNVFVEKGLPNKKLEGFHYTDLRARLRGSYPVDVDDDSVYFHESEEHREWVREFVGDPRARVVRVANGVASISSHTIESADMHDSLAALNAALAFNEVRIDIQAEQVETIVLNHAAFGGRRKSVHPRHVITVGTRAQLTLIELHTSPGIRAPLTNEQITLNILSGARVEHIKLLEDAGEHLAGVHVRVENDCVYSATTLVVRAPLARHAVDVNLAGSGSKADISSIALLGGEMHAGFNVHVEHSAPNCTSTQEVRIVASDRGHGVAQSLVRVAPGARGSDGRQMIRGLILGERAEIDAKPELEILNDDVKCSHGTALGDLDPEAIFYLRSRGVPEREARALLIEAFLAEILDRVHHEGAQAMLKERAHEWLRIALGGEEKPRG